MPDRNDDRDWLATSRLLLNPALQVLVDLRRDDQIDVPGRPDPAHPQHLLRPRSLARLESPEVAGAEEQMTTAQARLTQAQHRIHQRETDLDEIERRARAARGTT